MNLLYTVEETILNQVYYLILSFKKKPSLKGGSFKKNVITLEGIPEV